MGWLTGCGPQNLTVTGSSKFTSVQNSNGEQGLAQVGLKTSDPRMPGASVGAPGGIVGPGGPEH